MHPQPGPNLWATMIPLAIMVVVFTLRIRRLGKHRPLKLGQLWIVPALLIGIAALVFTLQPPSAIGWAVCGVGLAIGAMLGWKRGALMQIHVDPQTQRLNQVQSPAALYFLLAIMLIRFGAQTLVRSGVLPMQVNPMLVSDVLLAFAVGLFTVTRIEMFLRARRMLAELRPA